MGAAGRVFRTISVRLALMARQAKNHNMWWVRGVEGATYCGVGSWGGRRYWGVSGIGWEPGGECSCPRASTGRARRPGLRLARPYRAIGYQQEEG